MDEAMSRRLLMLCACAAMSGAALAQTMADPTQPPPELLRLQATGPDAAPAVIKGPQLQSVLTGTRGRQVAVIDGQTVPLGGKFNGATLIKVGKNQVVLKNGREQQVLTLFPEVEADAKNTAHKR
jgi:MSHA biogenesis protein MshK